MDEFLKITPSERKILEFIRELKPFEQILITADRAGTPDKFLIRHERKVILTVGITQPIQ